MIDTHTQTDGPAGIQTPCHIKPVRGAGPVSPRHPPEPALLNEKQAAALLGVSARKFHQLRAEPWFPLAIELGPRALRWERGELMAAAAQAAPRRAVQAEPPQLLRQRIERMKGPQHERD